MREAKTLHLLDSAEAQMNTQTAVKKDNNGIINGVLETVGNITEAGIDVAILKRRLTDAIDEAMIDAERMAKHGRYAIKDAIDDTAYMIKKNPWRSLGYAAGAGLGLGLVGGWLMMRRHGQ